MKNTFAVMMVFLCFSCYQAERNCNAHRTGVYDFSYRINDDTLTGRFERTETHNIDFIGTTRDSSTVRWINDCEFILKKLKPLTRSEEQAIHMKILATTDSTYTFEYSLATTDPGKPKRVEKGVAYRVKD